MRFVRTAVIIGSLVCIIGFIIYPKELAEAASKGLIISAEIIIPSLFPFTVFCLFLFKCRVINRLDKFMRPIALKIFGLDSECFSVMIMSFFGGFPVGAKLINSSVKEGKISNITANRMLCYAVNSGPAFVIIGIGQVIFKNAVIGYIIYFSNIAASIIIALMLSFKERREIKYIHNKADSKTLGDIFVETVYDSSQSIIGICGFVILFSAVTGIINTALNTQYLNPLVMLLEISNGVIIANSNIYAVSFLTAFGGICVHMQILSVCSAFKVKYGMFFIFKLISGIISTFLTATIIKSLKITLPTVSVSDGFVLSISAKTLVLSAALVFMSITLLVTVRENFVEKARRI